MGGAPAPQWLASAFVRSARAVGATADAAELGAVADRLIARWQEPGRFHHGLSHLIEVLQRVDTLAEETHDPDAVRLAAWYHGAIFDTSLVTEYRRAAGEDKAASAELARTELSAIGVPEAMVDRITTMILTLRGHASECTDIDCQALSDADLGSLAVEPQKFRAYRDNVRKEFAHLDVLDYVEARIAIITKLLGRNHLFASPMAAVWEDAARENLAAELSRLKAERECLTKKREAGPCEDPVAPHDVPEQISGDKPAATTPSSLESEPAPKPRTEGERRIDGERRVDGEQRPAEVLGRPVSDASAPGAETGPAASWGIEREPSDLRSLPRRNARTIRLERRTELQVDDPEKNPPKPSGERPTRPKDDDATGSLFKPLNVD